VVGLEYSRSGDGESFGSTIQRQRHIGSFRCTAKR
jgi:hypothetical protein